MKKTLNFTVVSVGAPSSSMSVNYDPNLKFSLTFQADTNTSFLRAARGGELGKLVEFLETGQILDINTSNAVSSSLLSYYMILN